MAHYRHLCSPTKLPLARTHAESVCSRAKPICKRSHETKSTRAQQEHDFACQLVDFAIALLPEAHGQMLVVSDVKTCALCSTTRNFKSSYLLYEHIRLCHKGEKAAGMKGTDIHREWKAARQERRVPSAKSKTHLLTDAEKAAVAVVPGDAKKFACNVCDKILSKNSAIEHYTGGRHGMTKPAVSSWLVSVDQRALKKKRRHDRLEQAFEADQVQPVPYDRTGISTPPAAAESIPTQPAEAEGTSTPPAAAETRLAQKRGDQSSLPRLSRDPLPGALHAAYFVLEGTTTECLTQERNVQEQLHHDMSWTESLPYATVQDSADTEVDTAAFAARLPIPRSWSRVATVVSTRRRLRRKTTVGTP